MDGTVTIEAIKPVKVRFKDEGLACELRPGERATLPLHLAQRLADKASDTVRLIETDWLATWRELAALSVGITSDNPLYQPMLDALTTCDDAYRLGDRSGFWRAAEQAKQISRSKTEGK